MKVSLLGIDLLLYESKTTDKQEQDNWRTEKKLDGSSMTWEVFSLAGDFEGDVTILTLSSPVPVHIFFCDRVIPNRADLLSYDSKLTDKREQYDKMEGNLRSVLY